MTTMALRTLPAVTAAVDRIRSTAELLVEPGGVVELRIPKTPRTGTVSGYFDDLDALATAAVRWDGKAPGIYITLNTINPALLSRATNRVRERAEDTTGDGHVLRRRWLPIDFDAVRPSGISSTDDEHLAARQRATEAALWLTEIGFPEDSIIVGDSGSGGHDLVRIDLPNDPQSTELLKRCLQALDLQFSDAVVHVDQTTYNASRVWKLYGTMACKGDDTADRSHRRAEITAAPDLVVVAPKEVLQHLASLAPDPPQPSRNGHTSYAVGSLNVAAWLAEHGIEVSRTGPWNGWTKYVLASCPMSEDHAAGAAVLQSIDGGISFKCLHDHCSDKRWQDLRARYEPARSYNGNGHQPEDHVLPSMIHDPLADRPLGDHGLLAGDDPLAARVRQMSTVAPEDVDWLWFPYLPRGKVTLIEGDPGLGKSWIGAALATAVSLGRGLPTAGAAEPANSLILTAEDGLGDTLRPRLDAMGADVSRIFAVEGPAVLDETGLTFLAGFLATHRPALVILDPFVAYLGAEVDLHRANETRAIMAQLAALAARHGCAIVPIRHLAKGGTSRAIYRGLGSIDLTAACRSVLLVGADPEDDSKRGLVHIKSNLAAMGAAIGYRVDAGRFTWTGFSDLTAERILSGDVGTGGDGSALAEAKDFLVEVLSNGPRPGLDVQQDAARLGIATKSTLKRARIALKLKSVPVRNAAGTVTSWNWALKPEDHEEPENHDPLVVSQPEDHGSRYSDDDPLAVEPSRRLQVIDLVEETL